MAYELDGKALCHGCWHRIEYGEAEAVCAARGFHETASTMRCLGRGGHYENVDLRCNCSAKATTTAPVNAKAPQKWRYDNGVFTELLSDREGI